MADVIRLQDRARSGRKTTPPARRSEADRDATILLFTGIRYERIEAPGLPKAPANTPLNGTSQKH